MLDDSPEGLQAIVARAAHGIGKTLVRADSDIIDNKVELHARIGESSLWITHFYEIKESSPYLRVHIDTPHFDPRRDEIGVLIAALHNVGVDASVAGITIKFQLPSSEAELARALNTYLVAEQ